MPVTASRWCEFFQDAFHNGVSAECAPPYPVLFRSPLPHFKRTRFLQTRNIGPGASTAGCTSPTHKLSARQSGMAVSDGKYCRKVLKKKCAGFDATATAPEGKTQHGGLVAGDLLFCSDFESGNCWRVVKRTGDPDIPPAPEHYHGMKPAAVVEHPRQEQKTDIYEVWAAPDGFGTKHATTCNLWFSFSVEGGAPGTDVVFRIMNLTPHQALYAKDMRPVYRTDKWTSWRPVSRSVVFHRVKSNISAIDVPFVFETTDKLYFSFTYPYTVTDLQKRIRDWEARTSSDGQVNVCFEKKVLCYSPGKLPVYELNITGGKACDDIVPRERRKIVLLSARVHPCETPASYVLEGLIEKLLRRADSDVKLLLTNFVFRIVPMLNPDGVFRGHGRYDVFSKDLNRSYKQACPQRAPSIFAMKQLFLAAHATGRLFYYMDFHAHHGTRGFFLYGNHLGAQADTQASAQTLPYLLRLLNPHFNLAACDFSNEAMPALGGKKGLKTGCARVHLHAASEFPFCYTFESNFNQSHSGNSQSKPVRFNPETWRDMGAAVALATIGLIGVISGSLPKPPAFVARSEYKTVSNLRNHVSRMLTSNPGEVRKRPARQSSDEDSDDMFLPTPHFTQRSGSRVVPPKRQTKFVQPISLS